MNATNNPDFSQGLYNLNIPVTSAKFNYFGKNIDIIINAVFVRSTGKTSKYIVYFDSNDNLPEYANNNYKSKYRVDGIRLITVNELTLKQYIIQWS